jgi:putative PIN family toxin of toxin-antitoxin system
VVLDTSVLIAAHISRAGVCAELFEDVLMEHQLLICEFILDELTRKLREKFEFPARLAKDVRHSIAQAALIIEPAILQPDACRDREALPILGTAIAGKADLLITVDKDLLDLKVINDIPIVKPGAFWKHANSRTE